MEPIATSSINSRATAIKTILLAAWRAKSSCEEWENRIRKVLPRGVNGDVYDLADCLLEQALVGPVPNRLFIAYLKHAVQCDLVSHGAVLTSIAHQQQSIKLRQHSANHNSSSAAPISHRASSIICLLEFLKAFRDSISCNGSEVECLNLCHSLAQLTNWLLNCILNSVELLLESNLHTNTSLTSTNTNLSSVAPTQYQQQQLQLSSINQTSSQAPINIAQNETILGILNLCTEMVQHFIDRPFTKSLLFISKIEYQKEFDDILATSQTIQQKITTNPSLQFISEKISNFKVVNQFSMMFSSNDLHPSVVAAQQLRSLQLHRIRSTNLALSQGCEHKAQQQLAIMNGSTTNYAIFNSLYPLIALDVVLKPARSHKPLARQIATITNFSPAPISMTYCELIRVCMIGLIDSEGTSCKVNWAFFTFLKMPKLLLELSKLFTKPSSQYEPTSPLDYFASNQLTNFINDLKLAFERLCEYSPLLDEAEHKCNCDFFKCLVKELIKNDPSLIQLKTIDFRKFPTRRPFTGSLDNAVGGHMMLKTEPVVTTMLQTFDSDQDPSDLFAILSQLVSGKQFEFTLSAAASTERLQIFVRKLVEHNELNKNPRDDSSKNPCIQALIFDITFLILTYIAQQYGPELIDREQQSTTFGKWFFNSYNPTTRINCPKEMLKSANNETVSSLIRQLLSDDGGIEMRSVDWRDVCCNIPSAICEILKAWDQGILNDSAIKLVTERIKSKMCSIAVIAAAWLQCHIRTLSEAEMVKPLSFLQNLTRPSLQAKQMKQACESGMKSESYSERSSLMCSIIRKIYFELAPKTGNGHSISGSSSSSSLTNQSIQVNPSSKNALQILNANQNSLASAANNSAATTSLNDSSCGNSGANSYQNETDVSLDEFSYQSVNDRFISTSTTQEIFLANVKSCLARGWIDHKSLINLNSLFRMIGSTCFTNMIVEQILTSHESPSDLGRAVNITFGLFHLDIEACAFALLQDTIPSWLMGEKKQALLNQPRAFALAHLTVMTIIEVHNNLKSSYTSGVGKSQSHSGQEQAKRSTVNGIKQEQQSGSCSSSSSNPLLSFETTTTNLSSSKRIRLMNQVDQDGDEGKEVLEDVNERLKRLNGCISNLMRLFKEIMSDSVMCQRTLFPILFLQQTVVCTRESSAIIIVHLQPKILLDIINLFSSELTFELVLAISNLSTTSSRKNAAKAMCQLARVKESKQDQGSSLASASS